MALGTTRAYPKNAVVFKAEQNATGFLYPQRAGPRFQNGRKRPGGGTRTFFKKVKTDTYLGRFFLVLLARKCLVLNERIESLGHRTVRQRLIQYLLSQCQGEKACLVELGIKKSDLARLLGTISPALSRNPREMQEEGLIEVRGKQIQVRECLKMRKALSS